MNVTGIHTAGVACHLPARRAVGLGRLSNGGMAALDPAAGHLHADPRATETHDAGEGRLAPPGGERRTTGPTIPVRPPHHPEEQR